MSSHEKNVTTTIEKPIYARVAKRIKQIPPADRNILTSRNTKLPPSWNLPQFLLCESRESLLWLQAHFSPRLSLFFASYKVRQAGFEVGVFFGKPKWQVQWSEQWIFVFLSLEFFVNAWLAKNFGVEKNLPEARHQLYTPQSSRAKQANSALSGNIHSLRASHGLLKAELSRAKISVTLWSCAEINSVRTYKSTTEILCAIAW